MTVIDRYRQLFNSGFSEFPEDWEEDHPARLEWERDRAEDRAEVLRLARESEHAELAGPTALANDPELDQLVMLAEMLRSA